MPQTDQTFEQVLDSLTADDEDAIAYHFGAVWTDLAETDPSKILRAVIFTVKRREGATDDEARAAARALTTKECKDFFAEPSEEESGKDEPQEESPEPSLSSVS